MEKKSHHQVGLAVQEAITRLNWAIFDARNKHDFVAVHHLTEKRDHLDSHQSKAIAPLIKQIENAYHLGWEDTYLYYQGKYYELTSSYYVVTL